LLLSFCFYKLNDLIQRILILRTSENVFQDIEHSLHIITMLSLFQARDAYCESVSSGPSDALATLHKGTLSYPFDQAFEDGKTKWPLSPVMLSGHLEGLMFPYGQG
jgi:hypothetical protein